jgi:hypothetical protein
MSQPPQAAKALALSAGCRFNGAFFNRPQEQKTMTTRRRRITLDASMFNAASMAIVTMAALHISPVRAQVSTPASKAPTTVAAAPPNPEIARYLEAFERSDKNGDGKLSPAEAEHLPAIAQRFELIDTDRDGFISKTEYLEALKP